MQAALAEFPHTSLVTLNIANLHSFKAVADMKYSWAVLLLQTQKKLHALRALFNSEHLMIIGSNRTRAAQQERLPVEPRLHV